MTDLVQGPQNPQNTGNGQKPSQQGSAESAARIQEIIDTTGMTKEQAAAALAASNEMAKMDPAAVMADQLLQDASMLRAAFQQEAQSVAKSMKGMTPSAADEANHKLFVDLQAVIMAEAAALTAHNGMREEQRKEIIWAEQSQMLAASEAAAEKKKNNPKVGFAPAAKAPNPKK